MGEVEGDDFDAALETAQRIGNHLGAAGILAKRAESAATMGNLDAALRDFEAATAIAEDQGARPALARMLVSWGDSLRRAGRTAEARPILERSATLLTELGLTREADAVRTTLALGETKLDFG
jgi:tetratricopeptide (TPR) repeat protein